MNPPPLSLPHPMSFSAVCVCVCACACARVRVRVCETLCACDFAMFCMKMFVNFRMFCTLLYY